MHTHAGLNAKFTQHHQVNYGEIQRGARFGAAGAEISDDGLTVLGCEFLSTEKKEGGSVYDCQSYLDRYADLRKAFGGDCGDPDTETKALQHWNTHGQKEKRNASELGNGVGSGDEDVCMCEYRQ